jgi:hypothetical protein
LIVEKRDGAAWFPGRAPEAVRGGRRAVFFFKVMLTWPGFGAMHGYSAFDLCQNPIMPTRRSGGQ